ncbi:hypothetical protein CCACVL1_26944 [Corchorus capsularis]|uniref:Uncharacterized protein n=1 Tax=Corchorus capsularis TaxID=210143 RepID=A0A1R3GCQ3_COCAP|nr:hypothetical protein CCACVL1_26944 [Corchorus capsularis]
MLCSIEDFGFDSLVTGHSRQSLKSRKLNPSPTQQMKIGLGFDFWVIQILA